VQFKRMLVFCLEDWGLAPTPLDYATVTCKSLWTAFYSDTTTLSHNLDRVCCRRVEVK